MKKITIKGNVYLFSAGQNFADELARLCGGDLSAMERIVDTMTEAEKREIGIRLALAMSQDGALAAPALGAVPLTLLDLKEMSLADKKRLAKTACEVEKQLVESARREARRMKKFIGR